MRRHQAFTNTFSRVSPPAADEIDAIVARNVALAASFDDATCARLRELTATLIAHKRWEPVGNIALNDEVLVSVRSDRL